jgi:hypothetical protein
MALPNEIGYLKNLTHLVLCKNKLNEIPEDIGNLSNLIVLNLQVSSRNWHQVLVLTTFFLGQLFVRSSCLVGQSDEFEGAQYRAEFVHFASCVRIQVAWTIATLSEEKHARDIIR